MWCLWETLYSPKVKPAQCDNCPEQVTSVCIQYIIQCLIQSGLHTTSHVHPIAPCAILFLACFCYPVPQGHTLRCRSHSSGAIVLLTFHVLREQPLSYEPSFSMVISWSWVHWTVDWETEWAACVPDDWEWSGRLASEKFLSPDGLILELAVKVIISVIVKFIEEKMQFRCSHIMSHEVSQVLAIRLAAQHQLELIRSLRARERIHACWAHSQWWECLPSMKLNLLLPSSPSLSSISMKFSAMAAASILFSSMCVIFSWLFVLSLLTVYLFIWSSSVCCRWSLVKSYATWYKRFSTSRTYVLSYDITPKR